jgi:hypothetical protein
MSKRDANPTGELYCDTRFGGIERWYYGKPEDADMRIPRDVVKSVCFLCVKAPDGSGQLYDHFIGTAFFVRYRHEVAPFSLYTYLVTAKHVLRQAKDGGFNEIFVRLNTHEGTSQTLPVPDEWVHHENKGVDLAVLPFAPDSKSFDLDPLLTTEFSYVLDKEQVGWFDIGIGDDLFVTGLFIYQSGDKRNIPIMRSGIISAMPEEPLTDESGETYYAYLAEVRSIGGLSGSPVFVLRWPKGSFRISKKELKGDPAELARFLNESLDNEPQTYLLGVIRGHWDLERQGEDSVPREIEASEIDKLNTGIALITPAWEILDILKGKVLTKQRKKAEKERRKENLPTQDSALPAKQVDTVSVKNPAAVALGLLGGAKGGHTRAANLSPAKRKRIAKNAAKARWSKSKKT